MAFGADVLSSAGQEMVMFFFVLSGFFIRHAQLRRPRPAGQFYLNRVARIYPPYLVSLLLSFGVLAYLMHQHPALMGAASGRELAPVLRAAWADLRPFSPPEWSRVLAFLPLQRGFFSYNPVYWSLLPEALFYLSVPLAFRSVRLYFLVSVGLYAGGVTAALAGWELGRLLTYALTYNAFFALGVGLYDLVVKQPAWLAFFRRLHGRSKLAAVVILGATALALVQTAALQIRSVSYPLAALLAVLSVSVLLAGWVPRRNPLIRVLHELGIFSFSLYLYHYPLLLLCLAGLAHFVPAPVVYERYYWLAVPLVTAGSYLLYLGTERLAVRFLRGI